MTVMPEIVRVAFLRKSGKSIRLSSTLSMRIISEFEGTFPSWCLAEICILMRLTSSLLGEGVCNKISMMSLRALSALKLTATTIH